MLINYLLIERCNFNKIVTLLLNITSVQHLAQNFQTNKYKAVYLAAYV